MYPGLVLRNNVFVVDDDADVGSGDFLQLCAQLQRSQELIQTQINGAQLLCGSS